MTLVHPTEIELEEFVLGKLPDDRQSEFEAHLSACETCIAKAAAVTAGDTLVRLVEQVGRLPDTMHFSVDSAGETPSVFDGTIAWETPSSTDPGTPVPAGLHDHPRYRLVRQIGEGGMGTVWLAEHLVLGRNVALKVIRSEFLAKPGAAERFRRESRAVAKLQHANIVAAYDAEEAGGTHFLVMEYVEGVNLSDLIKANGAMSVAEVVRTGVDTALGLAAAHAAGMIHRDIKPHNLIRTKSGRTKILDFGLATAEAGSGELTGDNVVMGTPDYIAPEQTVDAHAADARSDIYSLGCALYVMLTGKVPFPVAGTMQKFFAHQHTAARPVCELRPEVPATLEEVVARMMAKRPGDRYQSALEVAEALTESKTADRNPERMPPRKSRRGLFIAAGLLLFAFGITAAGVVVHRIKTDTGEFVVETESDDVEVAVKQGGKLVTIFDPKSGHKLVLNSGEYEFEINGKPAGLKLDIEKATLKRGDVVIAKIRKVLPNSTETPTPTPLTDTKLSGQPVTLIERKSKLLGGNLSSLTFDSAGLRLAVNGDNAKLCHAETGEILKTFPMEKVHLVTLSPDGKRIAIYSDAKIQGNVHVMDAETGEQTHQFGPFRHDSSWVLKFAPNGEDLLIGQDEMLHRANLKAGKMETIITAPQWNEMRFAEISPDGTRLLIPDTIIGKIGGREAAVRILEYPSCKDIGRITVPNVPQNRINTVKWTRNGNGIACLIHTGELLGFDWPDCKQSFRVKAHEANGNLAVFPNGLSIASVSSDGWLRVWDAESGRKLGEVSAAATWGVAVAPGGKSIATGSITGEAKLWAVLPAGRVEPPPVVPNPVDRIKATDGWIGRIAFGKNGTELISSGAPPALWNATTGARLRTLAADATAGWNAVYSPDHTLMATNGTHTANDGGQSVVVQDATTGKSIAKFGPISCAAMWGLAISPDNRTVVFNADAKVYRGDIRTGLFEKVFDEAVIDVRDTVISPDGTRVAHTHFTPIPGLRNQYAFGIRVWDLITGKTIQRMSGLGDEGIRALAWLPGGKELVAGHGLGAVRVWNIETGKATRTIAAHKGPIDGLALSPDGTRLVTSGDDGNVRIWDFTTGERLANFPNAHPGAALGAAIRPDGKFAATSGKDGAIRFWKLAGLESKRVEVFEEVTQFDRTTNPFIADVALTPDGKTLIAIDAGNTVTVREFPVGKLKTKFAVNAHQYTTLAVSPDEKTVAVGGASAAEWYDITTGKLLGEFAEPSGRVRGLQFTKDGKSLFVCGLTAATLWDLTSKKQLWRFESDKSWFHCGVLSPDDTVAYVGFGQPDHPTGQGGVRVLNVKTGKAIKEFPHPVSAVAYLGLSSDGRRLVGGYQGGVSMWDTATGKMLATLKHRGASEKGAFTPDGSRIVTVGQIDGGNDDLHLCLWDAETGTLLGWEGQAPSAYGLTLDKKGERAISGGQDGVVRVWKIAPR